MHTQIPRRRSKPFRYVDAGIICFPAASGKVPAGFADRFAEVNGVLLHYMIGAASHAGAVRTGEKASGDFLIQRARLVGPHCTGTGDRFSHGA